MEKPHKFRGQSFSISNRLNQQSFQQDRGRQTHGAVKIMIKKIKTPFVRIGMYITAFGDGSDSLNFKKPPFLLQKNSTRLRLQASNIQFILIDTDKGLDIDPEVFVEKKFELDPPPFKKNLMPLKRKISVQEELPTAKRVMEQAYTVMKSLMTNIQQGKPLDTGALEPLTEKIMESVFRNNNALVSLTHIKNKDDYTFMHSVSVAGLLIVLAKANNLSEEVIYQIALGGLLHDIGKMRTPDKILNKPEALTKEEFAIIRNHVKDAEPLIKDHLNLSGNTLDVVFQHHEKIDGTGYPYGLLGNQISEIGKMSAIADVYNALTSSRVYKCAWEPAFALKKMLTLANKHLDKSQLFNLIYCLGVYPVGSFVEMESGRIGIVIDQHDYDITKPLVKLFYNNKREYTQVKTVDLSQEKDDRILTPINPEEYGIDLKRCIGDF